MLYDIVYALIIVRNRKKLNNSKMIDYRIGSCIFSNLIYMISLLTHISLRSLYYTMSPASIMKMMKAKNTFTANHPKFVSFLQYAFGSGIPADSVIEITVTKPGQEPVTSNIRVLQSDLELLDSLKDIN